MGICGCPQGKEPNEDEIAADIKDVKTDSTYIKDRVLTKEEKKDPLIKFLSDLPFDNVRIGAFMEVVTKCQIHVQEDSDDEDDAEKLTLEYIDLDTLMYELVNLPDN